MNTDAQPLLLELADTIASGRELSLSFGGFQIRGQVSLEGAQLHVAGRDGTVTATRLLITNATVMGHDLRLGGQELEAFNATVSWGTVPSGGCLPPRQQARRRSHGDLPVANASRGYGPQTAVGTRDAGPRADRELHPIRAEPYRVPSS